MLQYRRYKSKSNYLYGWKRLTTVRQSLKSHKVCLISKRHRFCSLRLSKKITTRQVAGRNNYFRLFPRLAFLSRGSQEDRRRLVSTCRSKTTRARSAMSMNLFIFERKAQGAFVETRRQEARWTEAESLGEVNRKRSRNFIPVTSTIGQTTRYRPRECQPLEYRSPQRRTNCEVHRTFLPMANRHAHWTTLSWEGDLLTDHLTSRWQSRRCWFLARYLKTHTSENFPWLCATNDIFSIYFQTF